MHAPFPPSAARVEFVPGSSPDRAAQTIRRPQELGNAPRTTSDLSASAPCSLCVCRPHPSVQRAHLLEFAPVTPSLTSLRPLFFFLLDFSRPRRFAPSSPILAPPSSHLHHSTQSHRLHDGILGSHRSFVCGGRALRRKSTHWALCFDQCSPNLKCK